MSKRTPSEPNITADLSYAWRDRLIVLALIFLLFCGLVVYLAITISGTHTLRVRNARERNESTARLCAQLLDEQCDSAFSVLQALARRSVLESSITRERFNTAHQLLQDAVELVPDLMATALYRADGTLLDRYPRTVELQNIVSKEAWFKRVVAEPGKRPLYVNDVVRLPDVHRTEAIAVAIPLGAANHPPVGYLLAFFRLGDIYNWLRAIHVTNGAVLIVDSVGRIVATSSDSLHEYPYGLQTHPILPGYYSPYERARRGEHGAANYTASPLPEEIKGYKAEGEVVVGYAFARRPGWVVLVIQPTEAAFAASQFLLRRLSIVGGPLLLALPFFGWVLLYLYERQQRLSVVLAQRNELLRHADQAKSDLLANVSHDLKTPIASMHLSVSGLLESDVPKRRDALWDTQQVTDCLTLVNQELDLLAARVRNLLDMSRLEANAAPPCRETCDLLDVVAGVLERLRPLMRDRHIVASFPPTPLLVECDQAQMETVVLNLLENALKYSPKGSPLFLTGTIQGGKGIIQVANEGTGFPEGEERRVFEKFYRVGTPHAAGGTGLGLAICKTIIEAHDGKIWGRTLAAGKVEFAFSLPLSDLATPEAQSYQAKELQENYTPAARRN